jgi:hypothetical protein
MTSNHSTTEPILTPISVDLKQLVEHGESPTAIILVIAIFTAVLLQSLTKLVGGVSSRLHQSNGSEKDEG